jgi:hypothetical protein
VVSTTAKFFHHRHQRHDAYGQAHEQGCHAQVPFDLLLERRDETSTGETVPTMALET